MIQARYGWDDEYVLSRPYCRFLQIVETIAVQMAAEEKNRYTEAAFTGWQLQHLEEPVTFQEYLRLVGLGEPIENPGAEASIEKANEVLARLRGQQPDGII